MNIEGRNDVDDKITRDKYEEVTKTIGQLSQDVNDAQKLLDVAMRHAIKAGIHFTDLALTLGVTEAAVRQRAARMGWYEPGSRRRNW